MEHIFLEYSLLCFLALEHSLIECHNNYYFVVLMLGVNTAIRAESHSAIAEHCTYGMQKNNCSHFFMTRCTFWRLNPVRLGSHKLSYQLGCQIWVKLLIFLHWVLYLWTSHIFLGLLVRSLFYPLLRLNLILFLFMWHPTTFYSLAIWWLNVGCFRHRSLQFNLLLH